LEHTRARDRGGGTRGRARCLSSARVPALRARARDTRVALSMRERRRGPRSRAPPTNARAGGARKRLGRARTRACPRARESAPELGGGGHGGLEIRACSTRRETDESRRSEGGWRSARACVCWLFPLSQWRARGSRWITPALAPPLANAICTRGRAEGAGVRKKGKRGLARGRFLPALTRPAGLDRRR